MRIDGGSMQPTLQHGEHVLVRPQSHAIVGEVVLCRHPYKRDVRIIKRVAATDETGIFLVGDDPSESTDSRSFGIVPWSHLSGVVTSKMG